MKDLYGFIGIQRNVISNADKRIKLLLDNIFSTLEKYLGIQIENYESFKEVVRERKNKNDDYSYFWDWMEDKGREHLQFILSNNLSDRSETHDLLDYREMVLEFDIDSGSIDNFFTSIADTLSIVQKYIEDTSEEAAAIEEEYYNARKVTETIRYNVSEQEDKYKNIHWTVSTNPADFKQDFCYY